MLLCSSSELFSSRSSVVMLLYSLRHEFPWNFRCSHRLRGFRCIDCPLSYECQCKISEFSVMYDYLYTKTRQKLGRSLTEASQKLHRSLTEASQKLDRSFTEASQKLHRSFREFPDHCSLKAIVYRIVFLSKLESFTGADMQRRFRRTCPVCGRPDLKNISTHLLQVHGLSSEERKPYLKQAQVSSGSPASKGLRI